MEKNNQQSRTQSGEESSVVVSENKEAQNFIDKLGLESLLPKEFTGLEEEQKLKVIYDLKRRIVDIVKSDAQTQYSEELSKKSAFKKVLSSVGKEKNIKNLETEIFKKLKDTAEGKELIKKDLEILIQKASEKPIYIDRDGTPEIIYINNIKDSREKFEASLNFNRAANEFTKIPYEWGLEKKGKHKKIFDEKKNEYQIAVDILLRTKTQEKPDDKNKILTEILEIDNAVQMEQLLNTHPEFEKELNDFERSAGGKEMIKSAGNFLQTITGGKNLTNKLLTAGGFGARTLVKGAAAFSGATIITAVAAPVIGGAIGYLRGSLRAKEELIERKKGARHGKKDESKEARNIENAENLNARMITMLEALENTSTREQHEKKLDQIKRRIAYTQGKLADGLVNFGDSKTALNNQYNLVSNLNRALVVSTSLEETTRKDIDERLEKFLSYKSEKISKVQKEFIKKQAKKGMIYGASFALAGYGVRALGEHFGWWGNGGAENTSDTKTEESGISSERAEIDTPTKMSYEEKLKSNLEKEAPYYTAKLSYNGDEDTVTLNGDVGNTKITRNGHIYFYNENGKLEGNRELSDDEIKFYEKIGFKINSTETTEEATTKMSYEEAAKEIEKAQNTTQEELKAKLGEKSVEASKPEDVTTPETIKPENIAVIQKGEGIEHAFRRQIVADTELAKSLGFQGDINDTKALHEFSGGAAHRIALEHGYVDKITGEEIRIKTAGEVAYRLKLENGELKVDEMKAGGGLIERNAKGSEFEKDTEEYEYKHTKPSVAKDTTISETIPSSDLKVSAEDLKTKIEAQMDASESNLDAAEENANMEQLSQTLRKQGYTGDPTNRKAVDEFFKKLQDDSVESESWRTEVAGPTAEQNDFAQRHADFIGKNPSDLDMDELMQAYETRQKNIDFIFKDSPHEPSEIWNGLKSEKAFKIIDQTESQNPETRNLAEYLIKIRRFTGLEPKNTFFLFGKAKSVEDYVAQGLQKIVEKGQIEDFEASLRE